MKHPYIGIIVVGIAFVIFSITNAKADLLVFYNGDFLYGEVAVNGDETEYVFTHPSGATETFSSRQVRSHYPNISQPADGEVIRVSDFVHSASSDVKIYGVTGDITYTSNHTFPDGKKIDLEVENDFSVSAIRIQPTGYSFYRQQGVYLVFRIVNNTKNTLASVSYRVSIFDHNKNLLANKEFFIRFFPPAENGGELGRVIDIEVPNVLYNQIGRIRITQKY